VFFTIAPRTVLATGSLVLNRASIVFDNNPAIITNEWSNTIDKTRPTSTVLALSPTQSGVSVQVRWQGADADAGLDNFDLYVSENGGPFTPWVTRTSSTQATFFGSAGSTYRFYSLARDAVGNLEAAKGIAEATTTFVSDVTPPTLNVLLNPSELWPANHRLVPVTATITVADNAPGNPTVTLVSVSSNEPDNGLGDNANDIQGATLGTDDRSLLLRAERAGNGAGRVYTVTYRATDMAGNASTVSAIVTVPLNQKDQK
jgi:hypothetical protein